MEKKLPMTDNSPDKNNDKNNLLNYIAVTVETLRDQFYIMRGQLDTMRDQMESMRSEMATKDDLAELRAEMHMEISGLRAETRTEIAALREEMATKKDLAQLEARFGAKLESEITAVRGDIERVHLRLDSIERALSSRMGQIETEVSRLRSVVYLLVKDKPEMLRLLGQI